MRGGLLIGFLFFLLAGMAHQSCSGTLDSFGSDSLSWLADEHSSPDSSHCRMETWTDRTVELGPPTYDCRPLGNSGKCLITKYQDATIKMTKYRQQACWCSVTRKWALTGPIDERVLHEKTKTQVDRYVDSCTICKG
ncbi:MAG: hypothetical protein MUO26_05080 [Methanotrichaceae archaeon]|nr:hypothetical protein [Methanotrichaceae archaeon]